MNNFRKPTRLNKQQASVDGFIRRDVKNNPVNSKNMRSKFQTSYSPDRQIDDLSLKREGFSSRQISLSTNEKKPHITDTHPLSSVETVKLDDTEKRKKLFRKRSKKDRGTFKKIAKSFAVLTIALVIGVSSLFAYGYIKARNIFKGDGEGAAALQEGVDPSRLNGEGDGRVNILLIGKGGPGQTAPDLTDTLLLASIDPIQNETALVSVPRDMFVKNEFGGSTKINQVYFDAKQARLANSNDSDSDLQAAEDAGLSAVKRSVKEVLGVPVHYYVMVDFEAFENAINTVGGITIDVKEPLVDYSMAWLFGGDPVIAPKGLQTFDGFRALMYSRSRVGSSDFERGERQREVIIALQSKIMSLGTFSNPFKVVELLNTFGDRVRTDLNGLEEIKRLYEISQNTGSDRINSIGLTDPPNVLVRTDSMNGLSIVVPSAGLYQYDEIHSYIRNNLRDAFLKNEDASVLILNGTSTAGLATATSDELKSYGYNVVGVDNAPTSDYVQNQLIDLTGGEKRYTKSYLERRLNLVSGSQIPVGLLDSEEIDFVIILGTDEIIKSTN